MNFAIVFAVCICSLLKFAIAEDEFSNEFKEKLIAKVQLVGTDCATKEDANGNDISDLMQKKIPERKQGKCLIACFNEAFGGQDANGFSKELAEKALEPFKKENEAIYNKMVALTVECLPAVKSSDRCEAAGEMATCYNNKAEAAGITPSLFM